MEQSIGFALWMTLRVLLISLLFIFAISGLDDLFIDLVYYVRMIQRRIFNRKHIKPMTVEQLRAIPEKPFAIMVPAWDESKVIGEMLRNTAATLDYRNYYIFVGTYPNDEATRLEVEKVRDIYPNIRAIVTPTDGPTNKADCLNWILQGIRVFEKDHDVQFTACVLHDSEDVVHPISMKFYNFLMPRCHFIQLPVFPFPNRWTNFVCGTYMDEFAENHTKDMRVREAIAEVIPSAGVGTAISRDALAFLAAQNKNQVFDIGSLTEDYLMGLKLKDFSGKKIFLQQAVTRELGYKDRKGRMKRLNEPVATREYFPATFGAAVRQKGRWILGIAIQGWERGWTKSFSSNYFLFRDRKSVLTNLAVVVGYGVVAAILINYLVAIMGGPALPPPIGKDEVYVYLLNFVMVLFFWRMLNRFAASCRIYGLFQGFLSIPRMVYGNFLNFYATCNAIRRAIRASLSGEVPAWEKTEHAYPTEDQLRRYHRRLGDLLLDNRFVSGTQLESALEEQKRTGRKLGDILVERHVLWEEDLAFVLARQKNCDSVEIDPFATPRELLELIPIAMAQERHIFPLAIEDGTLILATDQVERLGDVGAISKELNRPVRMKLCAAPDLVFAIDKGYGAAQRLGPVRVNRLGNRLLKNGRVTEKDLHEALRRQKRGNRRLGEILVEMGVLTEEVLAAELQAEMQST